MVLNMLATNINYPSHVFYGVYSEHVILCANRSGFVNYRLKFPGVSKIILIFSLKKWKKYLENVN